MPSLGMRTEKFPLRTAARTFNNSLESMAPSLSDAETEDFRGDPFPLAELGGVVSLDIIGVEGA